MYTRVADFLKSFNKNLWILSLGWFVGALGFAASIPFLSIYFHDKLGMSVIEIGIFFGVMAVVRAIFQAIGGELSDRISRTQLLVHTQFLRGSTFFIIGWGMYSQWGFWGIAIVVTISSIFGAIFFPTVNALVSDILPNKQRLNGYAITRAAGNLGWAVGPALGGFLAATSYSVLFHISGVITIISAVIFLLYFKPPQISKVKESFRFSDLISLKDDKYLAGHCLLILCLYLVVSQLIAPFSLYAVEMVGISETRLGFLFTINGLMVTLLQLPVTRLLKNIRFTTQLATGAFLYFIGYGALGLSGEYYFLVMVIMLVTFGEISMSPPALTLTSKMAPAGKMGRYMGVYGFFMTVGWSFGPLYGGFFLEHFAAEPGIAWLLISLMAIVAGVGYIWYGKKLPDYLNREEGTV